MAEFEDEEENGKEEKEEIKEPIVTLSNIKQDI